MCKNTKWSELQNDKDFGLIVNSAVRYSIGRNTYMPGVISDFVTKYISILDNRTLDCIISDITREIEFADGKLPQIELWLELKKTVETEIERRNIIEPLGKEKI